MKKLTDDMPWEEQYKTKNMDHLNDHAKMWNIQLYKKCKPGKSIRPDKIHNKMIITGAKPLINELVMLFNKRLNEGYYPKSWNYSNIHPIPKPKKLYSIPSNYRPIAVSSCLGKVFEKMLQDDFNNTV